MSRNHITVFVHIYERTEMSHKAGLAPLEYICAQARVEVRR